MTPTPKLLIITAAFGEGHNSAAKNLALAAKEAGIEARVADPCILAIPHTTAIMEWGYRLVTTHFPKLWEKIYKGTDDCDFSRPNLPLMGKPERYLQTLVEDYRPTAVVSTYPVYPYFLKRSMAEAGMNLPIFTVVTDSIEINASWLRAPTDYFLVTDQLTLETMRCWGLPEEKLIPTGFPVNPSFTTLTPVLPEDPCKPFRILYFATSKKPFIRRHSRAILNANPDVKLTIVMGKNFRHLYSRAKEIKDEFPGRVRLLGWTRKVPQLLNSHHLVIGKAGGATVHEAIAARCPMLIHHLVPGQEEGNLRLLQQLGIGDLAETPADLTTSILDILANNASRWRKMKNALAIHDRNDGAIRAVDFISDQLRKPLP
ncbi:MGDG synthase family glycosyltransferase [Luteolibacter sp. AS25]|uniref:MGDG synthase family glycosyltransferase n=1 Tax=Luteolibacter sp. AS25 TaxID=3135776 RepID=UPI00398AE164